MRMPVLRYSLCGLLLWCLAPIVSAETTALVDVFGANWRYLDDGSDQGASWRASAFNDQSWRNGSGYMGYGFGGETTVIDSGPPDARYITSYFRHTFTVPKAKAFDDLTLLLARDDGIVVYLNGKEILRNNMPFGKIFYSTQATKTKKPEDLSVSKKFLYSFCVMEQTQLLLNCINRAPRVQLLFLPCTFKVITTSLPTMRLCAMLTCNLSRQILLWCVGVHRRCAIVWCVLVQTPTI